MGREKRGDRRRYEGRRGRGQEERERLEVSFSPLQQQEVFVTGAWLKNTRTMAVYV